MSKKPDKDYSTAVNPDPNLARYEEEIKELERQIDVPGKEWQELVDKAVAGQALTTTEKNKKIELERQIKPIRIKLEMKRDEARQQGNQVKAKIKK
jgi:predicted  nucleic acid-binding Zn-ribbon protein